MIDVKCESATCNFNYRFYYDPKAKLSFEN